MWCVEVLLLIGFSIFDYSKNQNNEFENDTAGVLTPPHFFFQGGFGALLGLPILRFGLAFNFVTCDFSHDLDLGLAQGTSVVMVRLLNSFTTFFGLKRTLDDDEAGL